ncbi:acylneuraminate cytidylyltransferase family protein [Desulfatiferula olefinivorans]
MKKNSERVPNKNVRPFAGKPLFFCVAEVLQSSALIEKIIVNTDGDDIADLAARHFSKVVIHKRPEAICGDMVSMNDIIAHDLTLIDGDHVIQTHSTNPLLTKATLEAAIARYFASIGQHDSLFSVNRLQTRLYWESTDPINHDPGQLLRTQDLTPVFEENSNMYIFSRQSFSAAGGKRIGVNPLMFPMDKMESIDIDEEDDFSLAEILYRQRVENHDIQR